MAGVLDGKWWMGCTALVLVMLSLTVFPQLQLRGKTTAVCIRVTIPAPNATAPAPMVPLIVPDLSGRTEGVLPDIAEQVLEQERAGKGRKIIAMSLFGDNPRYIHGAIHNAFLARRDWPGWTLRFYYGDGVTQHSLQLLQMLGAEVVKVDLAQGSRVSMYWRFFALQDRTATRMISRDADAQLSLRDRAAVTEWIDSGRMFHTMHDHIGHAVPIAGGMWGAVNGFLNPATIEAWKQSKDQSAAVWGNDQEWLSQVVWPLVKGNTLDHSSFFCHRYGAQEWRGFPTQRLHPYDFVGNAYLPEEQYLGTTVDEECPVECRRQRDWQFC